MALVYTAETEPKWHIDDLQAFCAACYLIGSGASPKPPKDYLRWPGLTTWVKTLSGVTKKQFADAMLQTAQMAPAQRAMWLSHVFPELASDRH